MSRATGIQYKRVLARYHGDCVVFLATPNIRINAESIEKLLKLNRMNALPAASLAFSRFTFRSCNISVARDFSCSLDNLSALCCLMFVFFSCCSWYVPSIPTKPPVSITWHLHWIWKLAYHLFEHSSQKANRSWIHSTHQNNHLFCLPLRCKPSLRSQVLLVAERVSVGQLVNLSLQPVGQPYQSIDKILEYDQ